MNNLDSTVPKGQVGPLEEKADITNEPVELKEDSQLPTKDDKSDNEQVSKITEAEELNRQKESLNEAESEQNNPSSGMLQPEAQIDYPSLSKEDLVGILRDLVGNKPVEDIIQDVESIRLNFYKKHKADIDKQRKDYVTNGGNIEEFEAQPDSAELEMKELLQKYRELKSTYNKGQEDNKVSNLEEKFKIIESLKDLINKKESINQTFQEFRDLQRQWRNIGPVPQQNVKDLWETYHHHVEAFYDFIRINQELRDLDLKKNLEQKTELCEKAEELLNIENIVEAFRELQTLHDQWREIGPVPADFRVQIWDRFKEATAKINKHHQEHFIKLKSDQKHNLEEKTALCEKAEQYADMESEKQKDWIRASNELIELQKKWRTIGFAPRKDNVKIFKRFRSACDKFFSKKRAFYNSLKDELGHNLKLKTELCLKAEELAQSDDWKKTMDELIDLQKKWKEIGPVPHKQSDKIWKRFRGACDTFFERKSQYFASIDNSFENNLQKKQDLLKEIETYKAGENPDECLRKLKDFQKKWTEIGYVPISKKDEIQDKFHELLNKKFDQLSIDDSRKDMFKFKSKIDSYLEKPNGLQRIRMEREKYISRLKQLENDILVLENNIGFFAHSKNAESMIREVEQKIDNTRNTISLLNRKINLIDDIDDKQS